MKKVISLVGARPQFIKEAVVNKAVRDTNAWRHVLVHSGQHYDFNMSGTFFDELGIPKPDYFLGVGSGSHGGECHGLDVARVARRMAWVGNNG